LPVFLQIAMRIVSRRHQGRIAGSCISPLSECMAKLTPKQLTLNDKSLLSNLMGMITGGETSCDRMLCELRPDREKANPLGGSLDRAQRPLRTWPATEINEALTKRVRPKMPFEDLVPRLRGVPRSGRSINSPKDLWLGDLHDWGLFYTTLR